MGTEIGAYRKAAATRPKSDEQITFNFGPSRKTKLDEKQFGRATVKVQNNAMKIKMNSPNEVEEAELEDNCTKSYAKVGRKKGRGAVRSSLELCGCPLYSKEPKKSLRAAHSAHTYGRTLVCMSRC